MSRRIERVDKNLQRLIGQIIDEELQPPGLVSVMGVSCDSDLTTALVAVSVYAPHEDVGPTLEYLHQRNSFIRRELASRSSMRRTPKLRFVLDSSLQDGQQMIDKIAELSNRN